jgi:hypothetical protein
VSEYWSRELPRLFFDGNNIEKLKVILKTSFIREIGGFLTLGRIIDLWARK